jgi:hypothetical protein
MVVQAERLMEGILKQIICTSCKEEKKGIQVYDYCSVG